MALWGTPPLILTLNACMPFAIIFVLHNIKCSLFQISEKYCREKGLAEVIEHKVVSQKWSRLLGEARKKRTASRKAAVGTGGGPEGPTLDSLSLLILSAADENADLTSRTDCEPGFISLGEEDDEDEPADGGREREEEENPQPSTTAVMQPLRHAQSDSFSLVNASIHGNQLLVGSQESLGHLSFGNGEMVSLLHQPPSQQHQHDEQHDQEVILEDVYFDQISPVDSPVHVTPLSSPTHQPPPQQQQQPPRTRPPSLFTPVLVSTRGGGGLAAAVDASMPRAVASPPPRLAPPAAPGPISARRRGFAAVLDAAATGGAEGTGSPAGTGGGPVMRPRPRRAQSSVMGQYYQNRADSEGTMLERISGARREAAEKERAFNELLLTAKQEEMAETKAIRDIQKETAAVDLESAKINKAKLEAENFTAQLRKSMTIVQYNQLCGKNIAIPDIPDHF
jgi:hypothetical protein